MALLRITLSDGTGLAVHDHAGGPGSAHGHEDGRSAAPGPDRLPLLLIHGNSCDHTFLAPQIDHFTALRRVLAPDLRGHGDSDKPEGDYTITRLAEDLAEALTFLGVASCVVVGHSMGGLVALELCRLSPGLVAGVACLDSTVLASPGRPSRVHALLEGLRSPAWKGYFRRYFEAAFEDCDHPGRREAILGRMLATPQHVVVALFEQWRQFDGAAAAKACRAPLLYVASSRPRTDAERLREVCPQLMAGQVVGSGHFLTLEVPGQVNEMIERFLAVSGL